MKSPILKLLLFFVLTASMASAQDFRASLIQYQLNALPLNPGYAARADRPCFDVVYFGNFASSSQLSQTALISVQAPVRSGGLGAVIELYNSNAYGEIRLRPTYAYLVDMHEKGKIAFGLGVGLSYADMREFNFFGSSQNDFMTVEGHAGVFYHQETFFLGASVLNAFDWKIMTLGDSENGGILRENPISLHLGGILPLFSNVSMKPVALLQVSNLYSMPEKPLEEGIAQSYATAELMTNFIIDGNYLVGILLGRSSNQSFGGINKFGLSATFIFGGIRLGYSFQNNSRRDSGVSLPTSHLITAGYDFWQEEGLEPRLF